MPCAFVVVSGSNRRSASSAAMPGPVSATDTAIPPSPPRASSTLTVPGERVCATASIALWIRFCTTTSIWSGSSRNAGIVPRSA